MSRGAAPPLKVPRQASRRRSARLAAGVAVGAVVGAAVGGLCFSALGTESTATALVRITPPAELTALATGADRSTPDTEAYVTQYVAGEVAFLSGTGFTRAVGASLGQNDSAKVDVLQEKGSAVIDFSGSAASDAEAIRLVQAAIDVYRGQVGERSKRQLLTILPALDAWEAEANAAGDLARVRDVRTVRESIDLAAGTPATIAVLQAPTAQGASESRWLLGAVLGALIGASLVPLRQFARRRKTGYLAAANDVVAYVDRVIGPTVDLDEVARLDQSGVLGRTLLAQCTSPGPARIVVVIGASSSSGAEVVASLLAAAAAEGGPVKFIRLQDESSSPFGAVEDGATVVVDAGALGDSWLLSEAVRHATDLIVVARLDVDTVQQLYLVRSATSASSRGLAAIVTYRPRHRPPRHGSGVVAATTSTHT
ncbi:hypothetical protein H7K45_13020 [Mycobacterium yunnanensis]|uniref:Uncharacterized protein n=1 Tax=Mycobacterium yunnanensis TaxID=368477 RepID=A0A9X2YLC4_9MYCO|nr:hypothetical protein [Mycobacterium yunnanensis]MCV7421467.1 hypothetical protein [Mycobacterium yunnanensis]